ncbi:MAG: bi-domain-containing oxidoreductase [Nitrospira sp.]|nr:bi-domain-containing oxidoreductase [Nitrospira sp.]
MKQVIQNYRSGILKVDEVPAPSLRDGGLLIANQASLISPGTEKSTVDVAQKSLVGKAMERPEMARKVLNSIQKDGLIDTLRRVFQRLDTPAALGYSCAGTVVQVGKEASRFSVGDHVACAGQNYASHAEMVYVPKHLCVKIPDGVDFEEASFVTLGAIALQGIRQTEPRLGDKVAVIGLGLLGQLTVQMLKATGCQVIGSDLDPDKLQLAQELGADCVTTPAALLDAVFGFSKGHGVDAVIITASTRDNGPVESAGAIARKKGRVVIVGAVGMSIPRESYYKKELELRLSTSYGPGRYDSDYEEKGLDYPYSYVRWTENRNMEAFLQLIQQRKVNVKRLVTHRFAIEQAEDAYKLMMDNSVPYLGIFITYPSDPARRLTRVINLAHCKPVGSVILGLIGAGNHVKDMLLPQLSELKQVSLRAVCTASGINAKALAEKVSAAYCTSDAQAVLDDATINTVLIGTRHDSHGSLVIRALEAGKHVFVEKPLCLTEDELERIRFVYQDQSCKGLHLMVGFNRRFSAHADKARAFFKNRKSPLVMAYRVNAGRIPPEHWIQDPDVGGGRIIGEVCHFVDYMQALCGAMPTSVHARRVVPHSSSVADDQCVLSFTFLDGSIGTIIYTSGGDTALAKERFEAHGDGKSLTMNDFFLSEFYEHGKKTHYNSGKREKGFHQELASFVDAVEKGLPPPIQFEELYAVTRACLLAVRSLQSGAGYEV